MNVAIAGAHGQIALRLARLLAARGDRVTGLIRNPDHATEVSRAGAAPVLCDLERASVEEDDPATERADRRCGDRQRPHRQHALQRAGTT